MPDGSLCNDPDVVLEKWRTDFQGLLSPDDTTINWDNISVELEDITLDNSIFNQMIHIDEVIKCILSSKSGKSSGIDEIPNELLKNDAAIAMLHSLYNRCFITGKIPDDWSKGIICPIPKSSTSDSRDPLSYRGITLAPTMYKIYCNILNNRITKWCCDEHVIKDEQNGFVKGRSTIDHVQALTNVIETRKLKKLSTFAAFIDYRKAYDTIDRTLLFDKLRREGLQGRLLQAVMSLYRSVKCCVRLNGFNTDWFDVKCGLKQGCPLSPMLFNLYINDLVTYLNNLDIGIDIEDRKVCILLLADDVVLLADSAQDLQILLDALNVWCTQNKMQINNDKSKIMHFRPNSIVKSDFVFHNANAPLETVSHYKYLGVVLNEFLDFHEIAKTVAMSASRALGLIISKSKVFGGFHYSTFTKLYDTCVWPIISYSAPIWGDKSYSCINAVQNRAMRFYLGIGKYTSNAAVLGEMGWKPPIVKQWGSVFRQHFRNIHMNDTRVNKKMFDWAKSCNVKNSFKRIKVCLHDIDMSHVIDLDVRNSKSIVKEIECKIFDKQIAIWKNLINRETGNRGQGGNKLRTYKLFKQDFKTEYYVEKNIPFRYRSAFAKFRCGVAPIRLETGRYENIAVCNRTCLNCTNTVENEMHVILHCPIYANIRCQLLDTLSTNYECQNMSDLEKFIYIFTKEDLMYLSAKTCYNILQERRKQLYK